MKHMPSAVVPATLAALLPLLAVAACNKDKAPSKADKTAMA